MKRSLGKPTWSGLEIKSSFTAYGSAKKLTVTIDQNQAIIQPEQDIHSATGLVFPGTSTAPPIEMILPIRSPTSWLSLRIIKARFVSGPSAI